MREEEHVAKPATLERKRWACWTFNQTRERPCLLPLFASFKRALLQAET